MEDVLWKTSPSLQLEQKIFRVCTYLKGVIGVIEEFKNYRTFLVEVMLTLWKEKESLDLLYTAYK